MTRRIKRIGAAVCLLAALTATTSARGAARVRQGQAAAQKSLYERLGGLEAISAVVDEFIKIAGADERINKKFAKTAQPERVRLHFIEQICMLTGGPCKYTGDSMKKAHHHMGLTEGEFGAGVEDLTQALDKFNVPAQEKGEFLTALAQFKKEIVEVQSNTTGTPLPADFKPAPPLPPERIKAGPAMKGAKQGGKGGDRT